MDRADLKYHGQVTQKEKLDIEKRCAEEETSFTHVYPKERKWSGHGVEVIGKDSPLYKSAFGGMRLDVVKIHKYLRSKHGKGDTERGTVQVNIGTSTQNYERHAKTRAELEKRFLDAPSWSGTKEDFEELVPLLRDLPDRVQLMVDSMFPGHKFLLRCPVRVELFTTPYNKKIGCTIFCFDAFAVSISWLDPCLMCLLRHLDNNNDTREDFTITAIWSSLFKLVTKEGSFLGRISFIAYTRVLVGNYIDKMCSYVSVF